MSIRKTQTGQRKSLLAGASVLAAATAMFSAAPVSVALAQEAEEDEAIVVTGTRIARRDAVAESPILTVSQEEMTNSGYVTVEQYLNTLPQVTGNISSQSNNPSSNGRAFIDLRGLGANRNLVLMDGRRPMGQAGGGTIVDANVIPAALVERTEIITGGAASTYGADAIAGVVNFIMRDNFEGFAWDGQYRITEQGDGQEWGTDFTIGGNFADGRGNAVMNVSFFERDVMYKGARDFAAQATSTTGTFPGGTWTTGTNTPSAAAIDALFPGGACTPTVAAIEQVNGGQAGFGFNPDGSLFCTGLQGNASFDVVGYTGPASHIGQNFFPDFFSYNFEPDNILVLPLERWNVFSRVNLDVNDGFRPYVQAMYTNYNATSQLAPTPAGGFAAPVQNPFVQANAQLLGLLNSRNGGVGVCNNANPAVPTGTGNCAPFTFNKRFLALGGRESSNTHDVWQIMVGAEGDLTDTWNYDVYASRGRSTLTEIQNGNLRVPQFQAVLNNPITASGGACSTWNPFGLDPAPAACAAAISLEAKNLTVVDQTIVEGTITGDLFSLPAGEVQVAIGAGYRDIDFDFRSDAGLVPGLVAGFNAALPVRGQLDWFDIFGEIYVPILANLPGIESLSLTAGYRTSDNSASGAAEAWKINMDWTVTDWLRFRGGVQTAIRAPNIAELFSPQTPNFPDMAGQDPCNGTSTFRFGADGLPGGVGANADGPNQAQVSNLCNQQAAVAGSAAFNQPFGQAQAIVGGNPNLDPETSDSWTAGFVLNSPFNTGGFLDSLYLSMDYWNIEMSDVIAAVGTVTIIQRCFNRDGGNPGFALANQWCNLFTRDPSDGRVVNLQQFAQNQALTETSGVDINFGVGFDLGGMGSLDFNTISTWTERFETATSNIDPTFDFVGSIGSGTGSATPEWRHTLNLTWANGPVSLTASGRFIDSMIHNNRVTNPAASPITNRGTDETWYMDLRGTVDLTSNLTLRAGVNNVADEGPALYSPNVQAGTDPSTYDILGRRFFVGFNLRM